MKILLKLFLVSIILNGILGCSESTVEENQLETKNGITYLIESGKPFTGIATKVIDGLSAEVSYKEGRLHGESVIWYDNGSPNSTFEYKDGKAHGTEVAWYANGNKKASRNYEDGLAHGLGY